MKLIQQLFAALANPSAFGFEIFLEQPLCDHHLMHQELGYTVVISTIIRTVLVDFPCVKEICTIQFQIFYTGITCD